ncbi:hydroxymethylglutaryl-CoA lyase [Noviherbaspirillum galbum]|uniref:Hydroxymethylglutaryl-CoA lyase n=1 Tax=Noviherbaspirillum galbum TaxID=2709383 RepID=A0A6B3SVA4_9BURK|nr:hydroxymethylglutaryl-CoA lyase [Noviherbaspirillum galbum]NEX64667.1 hydroxymethylglutaryl-CoA lyase [Noviherbaspirillum galbum]
MTSSKSISLTEVGPRDGLQNEVRNLPTSEKIALIERLSAAGCKEIEITSFVSPKMIPNLADAAEVVAGTSSLPLTRFALVPNTRGYERAHAAGVEGVTLVLSATDSHNMKNLNRTTQESIADLVPLFERARMDGLQARVSISMVFGCPFEGNPGLGRIERLVGTMADKGFRRIGLCDTIGIANPNQVFDWMSVLRQRFSDVEFELHFHDTYGRGLANLMAGIAAGVRRFDSCIGGIGGCPYAPGATGNIATEDVVSLLEASGYDAGIALDGLLGASDFLADQLRKSMSSSIWRVHHSQCAKAA